MGTWDVLAGTEVMCGGGCWEDCLKNGHLHRGGMRPGLKTPTCMLVPGKGEPILHLLQDRGA